MTGEINIKIRDLQGEVKALAVAANADGSDAIDSAYEHSLFTQYLQAAGIDASDYSTKYEKGGLQKSETKLVKEQKFKDGSTKEQVANMEQYEEAWQGALKTAFRAVGNDPQSRARLMEFVKTKPKLQEASSMADYAFRLGQKIAEMGNIAETDLKEFQARLTGEAVETITNNDNKNTEGVHRHLNNQDRALADIKATVEADLAVDLADYDIDLKDYDLDKKIAQYSRQILGKVSDIQAQVRSIKSLVLADLLVDIDTNKTAHDTNRLAYSIDATTRDTNIQTYMNYYEIKNNGDEIRRQGEKTRDAISESEENIRKAIEEKGAEVIDTLDPLYVARAIRGVRDLAIRAGQNIADFVSEHAGLVIGGIPIAILSARGLL